MRKSLIDNLSSSSNWYGQSDTLEPIATRVYFENLNIYETFCYGSFVTLPSEEKEGAYNKGWLRVDEDSNQTYGSYLTPSIWNETVATATYRADLLLLKAYTLFIYNGETRIGAFNISTGDYYQLNKTDYLIQAELAHFLTICFLCRAKTAAWNFFNGAYNFFFRVA